MKDDILSKAIGATGKQDMGALPETPEETMPESDGTVTIPDDGTLPEETKEGDIIQFECITKTDAGWVLKPVESRIKQDSAGKDNVKAAGPDNSSAKPEVIGAPLK